MWFDKRASIPLPFVVSETGEFDGIDGNWSTFKLEVGSPAQEFRVFVSTAGTVSWLPSYRPPDNDCPFLYDDFPNPDDCSSLRGINSMQNGTDTGYDHDYSSSWTAGELGELALSNDLSFSEYYGSNYTGMVQYGRETFVLNSNDGGELSQTGTPFALVPDNVNLFVGSLGLGLGNNSFGSGEDFYSFMEDLANSSKIPSRSWGYTAGASYQQNGYTGSLVLGGYDQARFEPTNSTFHMPATIGQTLLSLTVESITVHGEGGGPSWSPTVTEQGATTQFSAIIDSTLPFIYLPEEVCNNFIERLGLTHDETTDLYILNATQRATNRQLIESISFTLIDDAQDGSALTITLPYDAFDLQATLPLFRNSTPYFPIRRALSNGNNVLGRAFLQEAYVVADYERHTFTVAQAQFPNPAAQNVTPIYNTTYSPSSSSSSNSSSGLSGGAIGGIVVGIVAALVIAGGLIWWFFMGKKKKEKLKEKEAEPGPYTDLGDNRGPVRDDRRGTISTVETINSEKTAAPSELGAIPSMRRPPHSRHVSELSSDSEVSRKREHGGAHSAIFELEDMSDATQWARNEIRMNQDRPTPVHQPLSHDGPSPTSPHSRTASPLPPPSPSPISHTLSRDSASQEPPHVIESEDQTCGTAKGESENSNESCS